MTISSHRFLISSIIILVISAAWVWSSREPANLTTADRIPAPQKGFLAPDFKLPARGGGVISLIELRGRPVVLNFWASWCLPCQAEMPALQRVYDDYREQDAVIIGINATNQDRMVDAMNFSDQNNLTFPIIFDTGGRASHDYQVRSLPTTFFIDPQGIIQEIIVGGPISEALLRIRIEQLMRKKP
jgi:cytochrome c biogenesis protein CcmG, thiol:disulfide interchange protein DsbE